MGSKRQIRYTRGTGVVGQLTTVPHVAGRIFTALILSADISLNKAAESQVDTRLDWQIKL